MGALTYSPSHLVAMWNRTLYLSIHASTKSPRSLVSLAAPLAELPRFVPTGALFGCGVGIGKILRWHSLADRHGRCGAERMYISSSGCRNVSRDHLQA
jgi:hypothetical protein